MQTNDKYHHGDLRESLIKMGLKLLNEEGAEKFSLRKVAALCDVSHSAPYKHFKSKEDLIKAISEYVSSKFQTSLQEIADNYKDNLHKRIIELGKEYVLFMVENPDYLKFLFLNNCKNGIIVNKNEIKNPEYITFNIFKNCAIDYFKSINIKEKDYAQNIIAMWSMVHGIAIMLSNKTFEYEGDYLELVENILNKNLNIN